MMERNFIRNYKSQDLQGLKRKAEDSGNRDSAVDLYMKRYVFDTFCVVAVVATTVYAAVNAVKVGWKEITRPTRNSKRIEPNYSGRQEEPQQLENDNSNRSFRPRDNNRPRFGRRDSRDFIEV